MNAIISECQIVDIHETKRSKKLIMRYSQPTPPSNNNTYGNDLNQQNSLDLCCQRCCKFF